MLLRNTVLYAELPRSVASTQAQYCSASKMGCVHPQRGNKASLLGERSATPRGSFKIAATGKGGLPPEKAICLSPSPSAKAWSVIPSSTSPVSALSTNNCTIGSGFVSSSILTMPGLPRRVDCAEEEEKARRRRRRRVVASIGTGRMVCAEESRILFNSLALHCVPRCLWGERRKEGKNEGIEA